MGSRFISGGCCIVPSDKVHIVTRKAFKKSSQMRSSAMIPRGFVPLGQPHTNVIVSIPSTEMNRGSQKSVLFGSNSSSLLV